MKITMINIGKKILAIAMFIVSLQSIALAEDICVKHTNNGIDVLLNNTLLSFSEAKPFIDDNGRTQIPVRALSEYLGCKVEWNGESRVVDITDVNHSVVITIGSNIILADGNEIEMDTSACIVNDYTYIPLRYLSEALGYEVSFVSEVQTQTDDTAETNGISFDENNNLILPEGWLTEEEMHEKYGIETKTETGKITEQQ